MNTLRTDIPTPPQFMADLPIDERGYPVPWFVEWVDGKPEFRVMSGKQFVRAVRERLCWVCGKKLFRELVFVIGPMCAVNRINAEPPCHRECARYAAMACPFLTKPQMTRRKNDLPSEITMHESSIDRNPGATCLWYAYRYTLVKNIPTGYLFRMGTPFKVEWYCRGRIATRAEVQHSIDSGLRLLRETTEREDDPAAASAALDQCVREVQRLLPAR